uniref:Uncharacterized protein LOC111099425 n=1 Tax=Crassostrea virginica TaxID=6565 RepID=A0A8B8A4L3_CRAVI|nr:uncharacterized protein LOC111099425 [Crassostrea virginica]XP_022286411.1 uncharacterized protein LOC111099425 [Crassostrea virginica]XP_022286412.1 uncharacterized protein LOC111099425 [Crassostrea virginica]
MKKHSTKFLVVLIMCFCVEHSFAGRNANECKESVATATVVGSCPRNAKEWIERSLKKNCSHIKHTCFSFEYHCVINTWMNETIEVCARRRNIIGKVCTEYNYGGKTIQRLSKAHCKECPQLYVSVLSFLYQECYRYVQNYITSQDITTLPPIRATADPSSTTLSSKASDVFEEIFSTTTESIAKGMDNHSLIVFITMVSILVVAVIMLIFALLRQRKFYNDLVPSRFQSPRKLNTYREYSHDNGNRDEPFLES